LATLFKTYTIANPKEDKRGCIRNSLLMENAIFLHIIQQQQQPSLLVISKLG
jgi:hypothetical protein